MARQYKTDAVNFDWGNRPTAQDVYWGTDAFDDPDGKQGLSIQVSLADVAQYYRYDERIAPHCEPNTWRVIYQSEYVPHIKTFDDYVNMLDNFTMPDSIVMAAEKGATTLTQSMEFMTQRVIERDLMAGRFDRRKSNRIAQDVAMGTYRADKVRPYQRRKFVDRALPKIAVVGSIETRAMSSPQYAPTMIKTVLSILWACEAAGADVEAALVQGANKGSFTWRGRRYQEFPVRRDYRQYNSVVQGFMLTDPVAPIPMKYYSIFLNTDLWMHMKVNIKGAMYEYGDLIAAMAGRRVEDGEVLNNFGTGHGGYAVAWARQVLDADIVIAVGNIKDDTNADVAVAAGTDHERIIEELNKQMEAYDGE